MEETSRTDWLTDGENNDTTDKQTERYSNPPTKLVFWDSDILLTVHLSIILANDQIDAQILCFTRKISLLQSSAGFEQRRSHHHSSLHVGDRPVYRTVTYIEWRHQMLY
jgi:hypothetical protein